MLQVNLGNITMLYYRVWNDKIQYKNWMFILRFAEDYTEQCYLIIGVLNFQWELEESKCNLNVKIIKQIKYLILMIFLKYLLNVSQYQT